MEVKQKHCCTNITMHDMWKNTWRAQIIPLPTERLAMGSDSSGAHKGRPQMVLQNNIAITATLLCMLAAAVPSTSTTSSSIVCEASGCHGGTCCHGRCQPAAAQVIPAVLNKHRPQAQGREQSVKGTGCWRRRKAPIVVLPVKSK